MSTGDWAARLRAALLIGCAAVSIATSAGERWLEPYVGQWSGQGRFMGHDAQFQITFEPAIDARFVRVGVRYLWRAADGTEARFTGEALYPADAAAAVRGAWFDSEGHQYATSAYRDAGGAVIVHWGDGTMRGRTEYRLHSPGELEVIDRVAQGSEWQIFSRARLKRER